VTQKDAAQNSAKYIPWEQKSVDIDRPEKVEMIPVWVVHCVGVVEVWELGDHAIIVLQGKTRQVNCESWFGAGFKYHQLCIHQYEGM
jgi:hypothetical protein